VSDLLVVDQIHTLSKNIAATVYLYPWSVSMVDADVAVADPFGRVVDVVRALGDGNADPMSILLRLEAAHPEPTKGFWRQLLLKGDEIGTHHGDLPARVSELRRLNACAAALAGLYAAQTAAGQGDTEEAEKAARAAAQTLAGWVGLSAEVLTADEAMVEMAARFEANEEPPFLPTGFAALDSKVGPVFGPGRLVTLAARPGVGKTAFALQIASHVAKTDPVLYWCGEMSGTELYGRLVCAASRIPLSMVQRPELPAIDVDRRRVGMGKVADLRLSVSTGAGMSVAKLDAMVRSATLKGRKPVLLVADYLQRMSAKGSRSREEEVGSIARELKELAKEHDLCVLALAQMNREYEKRAGGKPKMSDLRESGQIEQESDAILFPGRDTSAEESGAEGDRIPWPRHAELHIAKHRHGQAGDTLPMTWHGPYQTWRDA
jgi:replicative DNA helicase